MLELFAATGFRAYLKRARQVLDRNWTGGYTKPSPSLYPHQWNWDSAFIAIGYAHYDQKRAQRELMALFSHQWENGMVPQIVFNPEALGNYFPEPDFWQAPGGRPTSGITMPPLHAISALHIYRHARDRAGARGFLKAIYPKLKASHQYFYEQRDPKREGLAYIRHPWESGLDNSPNWDQPLAAIGIDKARLPKYQRRDLGHGVPAGQRPSGDDYDRYVYLVDLFRRHGYDEAAIFGECPFLVQDVLFNSILCRAGRDLEEIAGIVGRDPGQVREWRRATARAIAQRLWSRERSQFDPVDMVAGRRLPTATAASFMPLFAAAADSGQAAILYERINSVSFCALHQGNCFTIPNFDMNRDEFDPRNYWRGPVWINTNWMLSQGLRAYGYREKADAMNKDIIQLPVRFGFHEYFDSVTGQGYGSDSFSWTAALFIDLVHEYYDRDPDSRRWWSVAKKSRLAGPRLLNPARPGREKPGPDLASELMRAIGGLKEEFYDRHRGLVDYRAMKDSGQYRAYLALAARLQGFDPAGLETREQRLAFWINLYNTIVVNGIVELEVEGSVRRVPGFFSRIQYQIGGHLFSPDDIEHGILRGNARPPHRLLPRFLPSDKRRSLCLGRVDPRIHFALVCGSRSCAPISFYQAEVIDEQLDRAARNFVNSSEIVILPERGKLMLSQIFKWYCRDFGGRKELVDFLLGYLDRDEKSAYLAANWRGMRFEYLFYDWNLNH